MLFKNLSDTDFLNSQNQKSGYKNSSRYTTWGGYKDTLISCDMECDFNERELLTDARNAKDEFHTVVLTVR